MIINPSASDRRFECLLNCIALPSPPLVLRNLANFPSYRSSTTHKRRGHGKTPFMRIHPLREETRRRKLFQPGNNRIIKFHCVDRIRIRRKVLSRISFRVITGSRDWVWRESDINRHASHAFDKSRRLVSFGVIYGVRWIAKAARCNRKVHRADLQRVVIIETRGIHQPRLRHYINV